MPDFLGEIRIPTRVLSLFPNGSLGTGSEAACPRTRQQNPRPGSTFPPTRSQTTLALAIFRRPTLFHSPSVRSQPQLSVPRSESDRDPPPPQSLRGVAVVVSKQPAKSFSASDRACIIRCFCGGLDQTILQPLMRALFRWRAGPLIRRGSRTPITSEV